MSSNPSIIDRSGFQINNVDETQNLILGGSSNDKSIIINYDLSNNPKKFTISKSGINWQDTSNNYTTGLERLALVQQAFQAVELPSNSKTLQINNALYLNDVSGNCLIDICGNNTEIITTNDLILNPAGSIDLVGKNLNMAGGRIQGTNLIYSQNNNDIVIEGRGTGDVILRTDNIDRVIVSDTGSISLSTLPTCSVVPTTSNQLVNKAYADSLTPPTPTLSSVLSAGNSSGTNNINMNNNNIINANNILFDNTLTENKSLVLLDLSATNISAPYPYSFGVTSSTFQCGLSKQTNNRININSSNDVAFNEIYEPLNISTNLTVTNTQQIATLSPNLSPGVSAVFQNNSKVIYTDLTTNRNFYLQDFAGSTFINIDLSTLTTGADNYSARLSLLGIQQFYPISYTSATNCKFFIRMGENSANNNFYLIKCNGDPTLLSSYSYQTYYFTVANSAPGNIIANGSPAFFVNSSNAMVINGQRVNIINYDISNDYLILGTQTSAVTNNYYSVITSDTLQYCSYLVPIPYGTSTFAFYTGTYAQNSWFKLYNNGNAINTGILQLVYWNPSTKTMSRAPDFNIGSGVTTGDFPNFVNADGYTYDVSPTQLSLALPYADNLTAPNADLYLGYLIWNKDISSNIQLVRTVLLESATSQTYYTTQYVSVRMYNANNIEVVSPMTDRMYISTNAFFSYTTYSNIGLKSTFTSFTNGENDSIGQSRVSVVIPQHYYFRGSAASTYNNSSLVTVSNPNNATPINYLNIGYTMDTSSGYIVSSRDMVLSANPLKLTGNIQMPSMSTITSQYDKIVLNNNRLYKQTNYYLYNYTTVGQNVTANTQTVVQFDATNVNSYGVTFNNATDEFTFNTTGKFSITYRISVSLSTAALAYMYLRDSSSNTIIPGSCVSAQISNTGNANITNTHILYVVPTTTITMGCSSAVGFNIISSAQNVNTPPAQTSGATIVIVQIE